ncbi:MAG: 2-amino-4-hydroxy-6-hydroxymethyldihydropteridine diphosphokinase [Pyrinomonadaceae bacterium]
MADNSSTGRRVFVGIGSNMGDRARNLLSAVRGMTDAGLSVARLSSIYETAPVDVVDQPMFLNMVAELSPVALPLPEQLLARLLRIEYALGRRRDALSVRGGARIIDLDLLLYGDTRSDTDFLQLPHPRLHLRRFALTPLAELAPRLIHPTLHKTIGELIATTSDHSAVAHWQS